MGSFLKTSYLANKSQGNSETILLGNLFTIHGVIKSLRANDDSILQFLRHLICSSYVGAFQPHLA